MKSHFQLIAGTNRHLQELVIEGTFRHDLLCRIHLWTYTLPSLKERPEDIEPNLDFEIERYTRTKLGLRAVINYRIGNHVILRSACTLYSFRSRMDFARNCPGNPKVIDQVLLELEQNLKEALKK